MADKLGLDTITFMALQPLTPLPTQRTACNGISYAPLMKQALSEMLRGLALDTHAPMTAAPSGLMVRWSTQTDELRAI